MSHVAIGVHFPKAGGTSLYTALARHFGPRLVLDNAEDPALADSPRQLEPDDYLRRRTVLDHDTACVFGHFHPAKYADVPNALRFTVLREPVENLISIYFYFRHSAPTAALHRYVVESGMGLERFARMPIMRWLMSRTYFGGVDMTTFDIIGRHEERASANARICEALGMPPFGDVHENQTPKDPERAALGDELRSSLRAILADDVEFYARWSA